MTDPRKKQWPEIGAEVDIVNTGSVVDRDAIDAPMDAEIRLPVKMWAVKRDGRTRLMVQVQGEQAFELLSWQEGYDKLGITSDPQVIPLADQTSD